MLSSTNFTWSILEYLDSFNLLAKIFFWKKPYDKPQEVINQLDSRKEIIEEIAIDAYAKVLYFMTNNILKKIETILQMLKNIIPKLADEHPLHIASHHL